MAIVRDVPNFRIFTVIVIWSFRPDFTSKLVHVLAFGTPKFYIAPYDKIKHELINLSSNCDVKSGLNEWITRISSFTLYIMLETRSELYSKLASKPNLTGNHNDQSVVEINLLCRYQALATWCNSW